MLIIRVFRNLIPSVELRHSASIIPPVVAVIIIITGQKGFKLFRQGKHQPGQAKYCAGTTTRPIVSVTNPTSG